MTTTVARKRLEILIDTPLEPRLAAAAAEPGIGGYTVLPALSGRGRRGVWHDERVAGAEAKLMFWIICAEDKAARLIDLLAPHLDTHGIILTLSDVEVVRGERF